ncbi:MULTISPECIES: DUF3304 domain-containing protein [Enterobacter]|uniref:DUF3304 domain-containing protein n=1 Tax=Enterobacter TaxID=547 RepID=UPI001CBCADBB|nr:MULTISPECIES: DUF3304 domain-containing protein [Enterobacter]UAN18652.1 DUF3304 domain-containing protein [Enterobacter asburiae]UAN24843.1 DUF3304 domain-containing protein [Enterobacter sp. JBIWA003]
MSGLKYAFLLLILFVSGCSHASDEGYTSGDLRAVNHIDGIGINGFSVNGYHVPGLGGGYCCIQLPEKWKPGLKAHIEWEVDPHTAPAFPGYKDRVKFQAWKNALESSFQTHSTTVDIPQYGKERCGLTVHFLPCNQVKVTTVCSGYGTPNYPIKEPLNMKEPASCPA